MEKDYEAPTVEIIIIDDEDILTGASGEIEWW